MPIIVEDFKIEGLWVRSVKNMTITKAGRLFTDMHHRCKAGGAYQKRNPSYLGCHVHELFCDFQAFTNWCHAQRGYGLDGWHLDKDLLVKDNKCYGPDTCLFIPKEVNSFLVKAGKSRGLYPVGVTFCKREKKFRSACSGRGLGYFDDARQAFLAYKVHKEAQAKLLAEKYADHLSAKAVQALLTFQVDILD